MKIRRISSNPITLKSTLKRVNLLLRHLWNVATSLLHDSVKPRQGKECLRSCNRLAARYEFRSPRIVGPHKIPTNSGRSLNKVKKLRLTMQGIKRVIMNYCYLIRDLQARLKKYSRKLRMDLGCQPKSKRFARLQRIELLLELRQPGGDEVKILQAEPMTVSSTVAQQLQCNVRLTLTHGDLVIAIAADRFVGKFLEFLRRIGSR